jgi:hypothetical protein
VSPVKYEMGFYIPEDAILHSDLSENLKYSRCFIPIVLGHAFLSSQVFGIYINVFYFL